MHKFKYIYFIKRKTVEAYFGWQIDQHGSE